MGAGMKSALKIACLLATLLAVPATAEQKAPARSAAGTAQESAGHRLLHDLANAVSQDQLRATDATLVGFGTRHALSGNISPTRGIVAAQEWVRARFVRISSDCGRCLDIQTPSENFTGSRVPNSTAFMDVLAIQRGTSDPDRVVVIAGHLDSRNT